MHFMCPSGNCDPEKTGHGRLAVEQLNPVDGLQKLCKWVEDHGVRHAAGTNAPGVLNAEFMISKLGLAIFLSSLWLGVNVRG